MCKDLLILSDKESKDINLLKGISILLVLFIHANIIDCIPDLDSKSCIGIFTQLVTRILVDNAVPMFFLISGFLFFYKKDTYINKIRKRFKSLFVPYVFWCLIGFLIPFFFQRILHLEHLFSGNELKKLAEFEWIDYIRMFWDIRNGAPILSVLWFLRNLIVLVILTPAIFFLSKKCSFIFPVILLIVYLFFPFDIPGISSTSLFWFCIGCYFSIKRFNVFEYIRKLNHCIVSTVWLLLLVIILLSYYFDYCYDFIHSVWMIVHFVLIYKVLAYWSSCCSLSLLRKISAISFFIYLFHEPWMGYLMKIIFKFIPNEGIVLYISPFVFVMMAIAYSYLAYIILNKYTPRFLNLVTGSRS